MVAGERKSKSEIMLWEVKRQVENVLTVTAAEHGKAGLGELGLARYSVTSVEIAGTGLVSRQFYQ